MGAWIVLWKSVDGLSTKVQGMYLTREEANRARDVVLRMHPGAEVVVGLLTEVQLFGG